MNQTLLGSELSPKVQTVRFHTPLADESPDQTYLLADCPVESEAHANKCGMPARVEIVALDTGMRFAPRSTVNLSDLEVVP